MAEQDWDEDDDLDDVDELDERERLLMEERVAACLAELSEETKAMIPSINAKLVEYGMTFEEFCKQLKEEERAKQSGNN